MKRWNFWACGKDYIIQILNRSNSTCLEVTGRYGGTYAHSDIGLELETPEQIAYTYASEANLLNQLLVLANMESYNAILIEQGKSQSERLILLSSLAIKQMDTLSGTNLLFE